jgi:hypothetical protein
VKEGVLAPTCTQTILENKKANPKIGLIACFLWHARIAKYSIQLSYGRLAVFEREIISGRGVLLKHYLLPAAPLVRPTLPGGRTLRGAGGLPCCAAGSARRRRAAGSPPSGERSPDDLLHIGGQTIDGPQTFECGARVRLSLGVEPAPAIEAACQARGDLRVEAIELADLFGEEAGSRRRRRRENGHGCCRRC